MPRGVYRVHFDLLAPSGDHNFSIDTFSDLRSYGDTLKSLPIPKVRCKRPEIGQPHAPSPWESGGTSGTYSLAPQSAGRHLFSGCFFRGGTPKFSTEIGMIRCAPAKKVSTQIKMSLCRLWYELVGPTGTPRLPRARGMRLSNFCSFASDFRTCE